MLALTACFAGMVSSGARYHARLSAVSDTPPPQSPAPCGCGAIHNAGETPCLPSVMYQRDKLSEENKRLRKALGDAENLLVNEDPVPAQHFSPGEYIAEELQERSKTETDFVNETGLFTLQRIHGIIYHDHVYTREEAQIIADYFGTSVELWLGLLAVHFDGCARDILAARDTDAPVDGAPST